MDVSVKTLDGKAAGSAALDDAIFGVEDIRSDILHRAVRWQLAKRQAGTHKTQSRSEVSVTTKKFIRQKGSGGARHGSRNAPIFVGGGVAHGPRVRSHAHKLPKAIRKLALAHALSSKAKDGSLVVLDDAKMDAPKTKDLRGDVMRRKTLVLTKDAVDGISQRFEGKLQGASPFSKENFIDDIQLVDGIGPKTAKALRAVGAGTLTGYVALSDADRTAVLEKVNKVEKAKTEEWLEQCKEMIAGEAPRSKVDKEYAARLLAKRAKEAK